MQSKTKMAKKMKRYSDCVETASHDSFPASDPPAWIECKAQPCEDGDQHDDRSTTGKRRDHAPRS